MAGLVLQVQDSGNPRGNGRLHFHQRSATKRQCCSPIPRNAALQARRLPDFRKSLRLLAGMRQETLRLRYPMSHSDCPLLAVRIDRLHAECTRSLAIAAGRFYLNRAAYRPLEVGRVIVRQLPRVMMRNAALVPSRASVASDQPRFHVSTTVRDLSI